MPETTPTEKTVSASDKRSFRFPMKFLPIIVGLGISVILIVVVLVMLFSGGSTQDDAIEQYLKCRYMYNADATAEVAPDQVWNWVKANAGIGKNEVVSYLDDNSFVHTESFYAMFGSDINFSHEIVEEEELGTAHKKTIAETYGIPLSSIEDISTLTVEITVDGSETSVTDTAVLTYIELENGEGYIVESFPFVLKLANITNEYQ